MKNYRYYIGDLSYAPFALGEVQADSTGEALEKAQAEVSAHIKEFNRIASQIKGRQISISLDKLKLEVEEIKQAGVFDPESSVSDRLKDCIGLDIKPITTYASAGETWVDVCDFDEATAFSVYIVLSSGLSTWLADTATYDVAQRIVTTLIQDFNLPFTYDAIEDRWIDRSHQ